MINYGDGLIYDTLQNLTWLDLAFEHPEHGVRGGCSILYSDCDWNYTWPGAVEWTQNLTYAGFDDWRLPLSQPYDPLRIFVSPRSELMGMLEQIDGWAFTEWDSGNPLTDSSPFNVMYTEGGQGPFQYPLRYAWSWIGNSVGYYHTGFFGAPFDFPDDWTWHATGTIYAVREGAPTNRVPEPTTLSAVLLGLAGFFGLRLVRRAAPPA